MAIIKYPTYGFLGATIKGFPKTQYEKIKELIDRLNSITSSNDTLTIDGGIENSAETMLVPFYPTGAQQNITAGTGGAINLTSYFTTINTDAGGDAFTLADGTVVGQVKKIQLIADGGGDGTVTLTGYTSIVFNDANDVAVVQWNGSAWKVLEQIGCTVNA